MVVNRVAVADEADVAVVDVEGIVVNVVDAPAGPFVLPPEAEDPDALELDDGEPAVSESEPEDAAVVPGSASEPEPDDAESVVCGPEEPEDAVVSEPAPEPDDAEPVVPGPEESEGAAVVRESASEP